jgi:phage gp46-like protein
MNDILIYESGNGGELQLLADDLATVDGLTNQVYIALFGGGDPAWFGNDTDGINLGQNATFEKTLQEVALNSNGLRSLENAAKADLSFFSDVKVEASLLTINKLQLSVIISENIINFVFESGTLIEIII